MTANVYSVDTRDEIGVGLVTRVDAIAADGEVAARIRRRRGGHLRPLDQALLHAPDIADGWNALLGAIRGGTTIDAALREAIILRVAVLNRAPYEWTAHEHVGRAAGLSGAHLDSLRTGAPPEGFPRGWVDALAYTELMTTEIVVPDPLFDALRESFDERQLVELTATVAAYTMVSRFLVALEVGEVSR